MLFGTLGCSEAQATSDQRPATQRQLPSEISVGHGDIGWDADASRGAELAELAVTLSPSLFQLFLLYLYPVRYPLSTTLHGLASFRSQAQRAAAGCRRLQAFALSPECFPAAGCCSLLLAAVTSVTAAANHQNPSVEAPPANFLALARRPKRLPGPLSLIFTTGPAILRYVLHSSTSTSTTRSPLLFFLPAHSRIPTNRSIDHHVGNKTLSRCRAVEGRSFLSSHSVRWNFCLVSCRSGSQS